MCSVVCDHGGGRERDNLEHQFSAFTIVVQSQKVWSGQTQQVLCSLAKCKQANQIAGIGSCDYQPFHWGH